MTPKLQFPYVRVVAARGGEGAPKMDGHWKLASEFTAVGIQSHC